MNTKVVLVVIMFALLFTKMLAVELVCTFFNRRVIVLHAVRAIVSTAAVVGLELRVNIDINR